MTTKIAANDNKPHAYMVVSAYRATNTREANEANHKLLMRLISAMPLEVITVGTGCFKEAGQNQPSTEKSVMVFGTCEYLMSTFKELMFRGFHQDAVLYIIGNPFQGPNWTFLCNSDGTTVSLGGFVQRAQYRAEMEDAYSVFRGKYFICTTMVEHSLLDAVDIAHQGFSQRAA